MCPPPPPLPRFQKMSIVFSTNFRSRNFNRCVDPSSRDPLSLVQDRAQNRSRKSLLHPLQPRISCPSHNFASHRHHLQSDHRPFCGDNIPRFCCPLRSCDNLLTHCLLCSQEAEWRIRSASQWSAASRRTKCGSMSLISGFALGGVSPALIYR